jgi:hypothetical protein
MTNVMPVSPHRAVLPLALALLLVVPALSPAAERLTDEQVKKLIEDIDGGYKTWKEGLEEKNLDDAVITSAERTIKVKDFLKDFDKSIDVVKDRFKPENAASMEVMSLLRRGSDVELRNRRQGLTPSSEWPALGSKLAALAGSYGVGWPVESMNVQAVRLNDGELSSRVAQMEKSAKQLRGDAEKAAKADKKIDKATRESLKTSIQDLERTAKDVRARVEGDRPAAIEVGKLLSRTGEIKGTMDKLSLPAGGAWPAIDSGAEALAFAFKLPRP